MTREELITALNDYFIAQSKLYPDLTYTLGFFDAVSVFEKYLSENERKHK